MRVAVLPVAVAVAGATVLPAAGPGPTLTPGEPVAPGVRATSAGFADVDFADVTDTYHGLRALAAGFPQSAGAVRFDEASGEVVAGVTPAAGASAYRDAVRETQRGGIVPVRFEETEYSLAQLNGLSGATEWAGRHSGEVVHVLVNELDETVTVYVTSHAQAIREAAFEHAGLTPTVVQVDDTLVLDLQRGGAGRS